MNEFVERAKDLANSEWTTPQDVAALIADMAAEKAEAEESDLLDVPGDGS